MTIFYSWQSDIPKQRNEIEKRLKSAIKVCKKELSLEVCIDRDTKGLSGSVDIVDSIFDKIDRCGIFVADISFVGKSEKDRVVNQNVLIELGYAIRKIGFGNIILLFNSQYGKLENLPFDIRQNRILSFKDYDELEKDLENAIKTIFNNPNFSSIPNRDFNDSHDIKLFNELMEIFPEKLYKSFLDDFYATRRYKRSDSDFLDETCIFANEPKNIFLNKEIQKLFEEFIKSVDSFRWFLAKETFVCDKNSDSNELKKFDYIKDYVERNKCEDELQKKLIELMTKLEDSFCAFRQLIVKELKI